MKENKNNIKKGHKLTSDKVCSQALQMIKFLGTDKKPVLVNRPSLSHKSIEKKVNGDNRLIFRSYLNLKICLLTFII